MNCVENLAQTLFDVTGEEWNNQSLKLLLVRISKQREKRVFGEKKMQTFIYDESEGP